MTERRKLRRNDHPDTSHAAAETCQAEQFEALALQVHVEHGPQGCTLDDLRKAFAERAPPNTQFVNRRTGLHQKGLVLDTGTRRKGESGKMQAVYVATSVLTPEWIEYIRQQTLGGNAQNPCFEEKQDADAA